MWHFSTKHSINVCKLKTTRGIYSRSTEHTHWEHGTCPKCSKRPPRDSRLTKRDTELHTDRCLSTEVWTKEKRFMVVCMILLCGDKSHSSLFWGMIHVYLSTHEVSCTGLLNCNIDASAFWIVSTYLRAYSVS